MKVELQVVCVVSVLFWACVLEAAEKQFVASDTESGHSWTNSLGMKFVPVPGTQVFFCINVGASCLLHELERREGVLQMAN